MLPLFAESSFWLPTPASNSAETHDFVFYILLYVMTFFFCLVMTIMLAFVVKYRQRKDKSFRDGPTHNMPLEITWTLIPLVIVLGFFVLGLRYFVDFETPPDNAMVVDVEASQWHFNFKYPNGAEADDLYLQVGKPVKLRLTSKDVSHALYIPAFRVQRNAVPGRETQIWFEPTEKTEGKDAETGDDAYYHVFCTQYCGNGHSEMHAKAFVLDKEDYDKKLADAANIFVDHTTKKALPFAEVGKKLYASNCAQCHTVDGSKGTGPTWKGLYKSSVKFASSNVPNYGLAESDDDEKWDAYLVESILHPEAKIVEEYQNVMPSQESAFSDSPGSVPKLSEIKARIMAGKETSNKEKKLVAITEYVKSVGTLPYTPLTPPESAPAAAGAAISGAAAKPKSSAEVETPAAKPDKDVKSDKEALPNKEAKPKDEEKKSPSTEQHSEKPAGEPGESKPAAKEEKK
jgi:cytochrome c oxidase subunit 2